MDTVLCLALFVLRLGGVTDALRVLPSPPRQHVAAGSPAATIATACGRLDLQPGDGQLLAEADLFADCPAARASRHTSLHHPARAAGPRTGPPGCSSCGRGPRRFCTLRVCTPHGPGAPRLYASTHAAGHGYKLLHLLTAMAVADRSGMNFGGLVVDKNGIVKHGVDFRNVLLEFLGSQYKDIFIEEEDAPEVWDEVNRTANVSAGAAGNILLDGHWNINGITNASKLLAEIRRSQVRRSFPSKPNSPLVVMHVRRGDLRPDNPVIEWSPDKYFYDVAELIRRDFPHADIHVFSCVEGMWNWNNSSFKGYEQRGMHVHLDEVGAGTAWSVMSRADVLVMSPSTFSLGPACLNPNCVILNDRGTAKMWTPTGRDRSWLHGRNGNFSTELSQCLQYLDHNHGTSNPWLK